jgi:hypothetical protein
LPNANEQQRSEDAEKEMKTEFTKLTEFGIPEMNSGNWVNSVLMAHAARTSAPLRLSGEKWLPDVDLNHDKQIQSLLCYRYTIGQTDVSHRLDISLSESRN